MPRKLETSAEKRSLHKVFCLMTGYQIPEFYFLSADCYGMKKNGDYVAGFVLKSGPIHTLRSFKEIPERVRYFREGHYRGKRIADFTGYFLKDKKLGMRFTWFLVKTVWQYRAKYFIYSYDVENRRLGHYYSHGGPVRLYSGVPAVIDGYEVAQSPVNVEVLTKWGIVKIFLQRTKRALGRKR